MQQVKLEKFIEEIQNLTAVECRTLLINLFVELEQEKTKRTETERMHTEMSKDYIALKEECEAKDKELKELNKKYKCLCEQLTIQKQHLFGSKTETMKSITSRSAQENEDPLDDDASDNSEKANGNIIVFVKAKNEKERNKSVGGKRRKKQPTKTNTDRLVTIPDYQFDPDELDAEYGCGNWRIVSWNDHKQIKKIDAQFYVLNILTPVISVDHGDRMITCPAPQAVIAKSMLSASFGASILYSKFCLGLPLYRQVDDYMRFGLEISRQTLSNWVVRMATDILYAVYLYMMQLLLKQEYHQADETTMRVISSDRTGYIWVHSTSELLDDYSICIYEYENTRGADHLRKFYEDFAGYINCDGYVSYATLEKESEGKIKTACCFAHARRPYAEAAQLVDTSVLSEEELESQEEIIALRYIQEIYAVDMSLKDLDADERQKRRAVEVLPKVDAFFDYIHTLDPNSPEYSEKFRNAIKYSLNHEMRLRVFLSDGNIPLDNNSSERLVKSVAIGRRSYLFCFSEVGAESACIAYSLIETAKRAGANPYIYLLYLLEKMPGHMEDTSREFLPDMMPWSETYKTYEKDQYEEQIRRISVEARSEKPDSHGRRQSEHQKIA